MVEDKAFQAMQIEYNKGGKFADFVNKACDLYEDSLDDELHKVIVYEYYKSLQKGGCNEN